jgi:hypothetical protein
LQAGEEEEAGHLAYTDHIIMAMLIESPIVPVYLNDAQNQIGATLEL